MAKKRTGHLPLRARIITEGETIASVSTKTGMAQATLNGRLLGIRSFTVREIKEIAKVLNLSDGDIIKLFFMEED